MNFAATHSRRSRCYKKPWRAATEFSPRQRPPESACAMRKTGSMPLLYRRNARSLQKAVDRFSGLLGRGHTVDRIPHTMEIGDFRVAGHLSARVAIL